MKIMKYILSILSLAGLLSLSSCDEFLTEAPRGSLSESNAFTTAEDAEALVVSCYDGLQKAFEEYYVWYYMIISDCLADNAYSGGDDVDINNIGSRNITPLNAVIMKSWKSLYGGIMRCNLALKYIPQINDAQLENISFGSVSRRQEMLAEVSFIRALHYFNLVKTWGCVPLVTSTGSTDREDVQVPRVDSEDQIYQRIFEDLDFASSRLPQQRGSAALTRGMVTVGAVNALFAKAYSMKGAPNNIEWDKVEMYTKKVMDSPIYSLVETYDHLFDDDHRNNTETILAVQYQAGTTEGNYAPILLLSPSLTDQNWRKYLTPSEDLINAFDAAGDNVRKSSTIMYEDVNNLWYDQYYAKNDNGRWVTKEIPFPNKWRAKNRVGWDCGDLIYIFRLADIVLLHAEAVNHNSGYALAASDSKLQKIRSRVGLDPLDPTSNEEMKTMLLKERRLELAYEGERFFDLKRYGVAKTTIDALSWREVNKGVETTVRGSFSSHMNLMPIPQEERDRNPLLTQNPGYN